jgi:alkylhydroperoxidase/carboxymuconolactone decarboxylase family protein YurZ
MVYDEGLVTMYLRKTNQTALVTEREKHLLRLAVTMARGCQTCTQSCLEKALAAGIEDDVLNALVGIVCWSCCTGH